jgi:hypothetical protein
MAKLLVQEIKMSIISDLINKQIDVKSAMKIALKDIAVLSELLEGIQSSQDPIRYNSFKVILLISEEHPGILYPHWALFERMLDSDNSYFKDIAIQIIANLTIVDTENRFEGISDKLINLDKRCKGKQMDLVKGYSIEALSHYFDKATAKDKSLILEFVKKEQTSHSPRTKKVVKEFIKKWDR